jgi:hypothetical protein
LLYSIVCEKNRALLRRYNQHQNKGEMNNAIKGFRRGGLWSRGLYKI